MQATGIRKLGGLFAAMALFIAQSSAAEPTFQLNSIALKARLDELGDITQYRT